MMEDCGLQITDCRLQVADYRLQIAGCRLKMRDALQILNQFSNIAIR